MDNITTLTPGDILRKIRKELGFKQHELAADDITRNLISLIENNRATLNRGNAEILVRNMNSLCKARGIDIELEFRDLFIPGIYDAKSKARGYMDYLKEATYNNYKIPNDKIDEIALFVSKWDLQPQNTYIYELIAKYYLEHNDIPTSYSYYIKTFENAVKIDKNPMIVLNLAPRVMDVYVHLGRTNDALQIGKIAQAHCFSEDMKCMIPIWYKLASINYNNKNYDEASKHLTQLDKYLEVSESSRIVDINILKILVCIENKNYKKALEILNTTEALIQNEDEIEDLLNSMKVKIFTLKSNKKSVQKEIDILDDHLSSLKYIPAYISDISLNMAVGYTYLNNNSKANEYLKTALSFALKNKDRISYKKIIEFICDNEANFIDILEEVINNKSDKLAHFLNERDLISLMKLLNKNQKFDLSNKILLQYKV